MGGEWRKGELGEGVLDEGVLYGRTDNSDGALVQQSVNFVQFLLEGKLDGPRSCRSAITRPPNSSGLCDVIHRPTRVTR